MRTPELIVNINDHLPGRYATTKVLQRAGFEVIEGGTGREALDLVRTLRPRLVILDINLPDMSGIDVCRELKTGKDTALVMVLQVSATNVQTEDRVQSLDAGADSFLVDPVEPEELVAVARALLRLAGAEAQLRAAVAERELLLSEMNHRVKNSLQLVSSILSLHSREISDPLALAHFEQARTRVQAIASIHESLYQADAPMTVEMSSYLGRLCDNLGPSAGGVVHLTAEALQLSPNQAIPLALIVNELITNALKHGRPASGRPEVAVELGRRDNRVRLAVSDNGANPPEKEPAAGLGAKLVAGLTKQLDGTLTATRSAAGYRVELHFADRVQR